MDVSRFLKKNIPMHRYTTIGTGGVCACFASVATVQALQGVVEYGAAENLPVFILGNGSNILFSDAGFEGIAIKLEGDFKTVDFDTETGRVTAGAGAQLSALGTEIAGRGYTGCAYMAVIPGTVGGAVRMNAGINREYEIKKDIVSASVFELKTGGIRDYSCNALCMDYRHSILSSNDKVVLNATFQLPQGQPEGRDNAMHEISELKKKRSQNQPKAGRSFGSVFKNPKKHPHSAGWYLEQAGMKGMSVGGAVVYEGHANWILNRGGAKSGDIKQLIETGRKRVYEMFGVALEREVILIPEDIGKGEK